MSSSFRLTVKNSTLFFLISYRISSSSKSENKKELELINKKLFLHSYKFVFILAINFVGFFSLVSKSLARATGGAYQGTWSPQGLPLKSQATLRNTSSGSTPWTETAGDRASTTSQAPMGSMRLLRQVPSPARATRIRQPSHRRQWSILCRRTFREWPCLAIRSVRIRLRQWALQLCLLHMSRQLPIQFLHHQCTDSSCNCCRSGKLL